MDSNDAEKLLRSQVRASDGKEVARIARVLMQRASSDEVKADFQRECGVGAVDLETFAATFAQGAQWLLEQYPQVPGPATVEFGHAGETLIHTLPDGRKLKTAFLNKAAHERVNATVDGIPYSFVTIPYECIKEAVYAMRHRGTTSYTTPSRQHIGKHTAEEHTFLSGVEESYHAVQHQDPKTSAMLEAAERQPPSPTMTFTVGVAVPPIPDAKNLTHETLREKDVVPYLDSGLRAFRTRKTGQGSAVPSSFRH